MGTAAVTVVRTIMVKYFNRKFLKDTHEICQLINEFRRVLPIAPPARLARLARVPTWVRGVCCWKDRNAADGAVETIIVRYFNRKVLKDIAVGIV